MKVSADAGSLPHFADWICPIWKELPADIKDGFYARGRAIERARELGVEVDGQGQARQKELVLTASYEDHRRAGNARTILINHGCGQQYLTGDGVNHPSYTGGRDRDRVVLHICPSERDAEACRATGAPAVAAGPVKMDDWYNGVKQRPSNDRPIIAISFHADVFVVPETRSAFSHYRQALIDLAKIPDLPFDLLGHGHPRWGEYMAKFWKRLGVPFARHFDEVLERADCYVIDNSSTLFEFASTDRPVMVLDAPWYRVNVNHGLRFWEFADVGVRIQEASQLEEGIRRALRDDTELQDCRTEVVSRIYSGLTDGKATERAVEAIHQLVVDEKVCS